VLEYSDLIVYRKARTLASEIFEVTMVFPREEMYSLTDQIRRSSRSVGAQIAEAWAKRRYERHFMSKLTDADGEIQETLHWIDIAFDCGYLSESQVTVLRALCAEIGRMLGGMISKSSKFCTASPHKMSEFIAGYVVSDIDTE
jgi:four helix bundle protein